MDCISEKLMHGLIKIVVSEVVLNSIIFLSYLMHPDENRSCTVGLAPPYTVARRYVF
jgi:hypothetical protein